MTAVKEAQCCFLNNNKRKQDEVKKCKISYYVKRSSRIINLGRSYDNIIPDVENLLSATSTTEDFFDSILKYILPLSSDTIKYAFIYMGGKIRDFSYPKKQTVALEI